MSDQKKYVARVTLSFDIVVDDADSEEQALDMVNYMDIEYILKNGELQDDLIESEVLQNNT